MSSDSGERRQGRMRHMSDPPSEQERLACPRCDSTNTKFCYYNNYNLTQPRYFCKSCRRYWTLGGSLRNIPVGGGTRKNSKRSRISSSSSSSSQFGAATPTTTTSVGLSVPFDGGVSEQGSFTSLLNTQSGAVGLFALGGLGLGFGLEDMEIGLGLGRGGGVWPLMEAGGNTWQLGSGVDGGFVNGGCDFYSSNGKSYES